MCVLESTETPSFVQLNSVHNVDMWHNKRSVLKYRAFSIQTMSDAKKYRLPVHPSSKTKSEYAKQSEHTILYKFCVWARRSLLISGHIHIPSELPLPLPSSLLRCSVNALGRCWVFFFVVFFYALVRSFQIFRSLCCCCCCCRCFFLLLFPHSFAAFIRFSLLVLFFFLSSVSFQFILSSFLSPFPSSLLLRIEWVSVCFVRSFFFLFFISFFSPLLSFGRFSFCSRVNIQFALVAFLLFRLVCCLPLILGLSTSYTAYI